MALARYVRTHRYFHRVVMMMLSAVALVYICLGIFFMAYAHQWESYAICVGLMCYSPILIFPLLCYCIYEVMYSSQYQSR